MTRTCVSLSAGSTDGTIDGMMREPKRTHTPYMLPRGTSGLAWALVIGGATAWIMVLAIVLLVLDRDSSPGPVQDDAPVRAVQQPTLAAASDTPVPTVTSTVTPHPTSTYTPTPTPPPSATPSPVASRTLAEPPTQLPILTATVSATPDTAPKSTQGSVQEQAAGQSTTQLIDGCAVPAHWERYVVQDGDTLFAFALGAGPDDDGALAVTVDDLIAANCLTSRYLRVGQVLYLPSGAAANAPPSDPYVPPGSLNETGPRTPSCPCTITVREGWRREQLAVAIQNSATRFTGADFLAATGPNATAPFDFVQQRPAGQSMEGFLFPGTYTVENATTAEQFRDMLLEAFAANVSPQMRADAAAQGVTFYQALTIASIVQRESRTPETQKLIASIFYNRYRDGNRLASTVTIQYVYGGSGAWWPRLSGKDLEVQSPFNTYIQAGLPPAPIDSPGLSAITAAVYPPDTNYYYHSGGCGGGAVFSETYEQHLNSLDCD